MIVRPATGHAKPGEPVARIAVEKARRHHS
jgi:hypothetical protein